MMLLKLRRTFEDFARENPAAGPSVRIKTVCVKREVYNAYLDVYKSADALADKLELVLKDGEHRLCMKEGRAQGYRIPDEKETHGKISTLRAALNGFDPRDIVFEGDYVILPVATARGFHRVAVESCALVGGLFGDIRDSGYLPWLRELKRMRFPYVGPSSLQEAMDVWVCLLRAAALTNRGARPAAMPANWLKP